MQPPILFFTITNIQNIDFYYSLPKNIQLGCNSIHAGYQELLQRGFRFDFVDNPFMKFNPDKHRRVIEHIRPRFATLRDYFSEEDCRALGIKYYSVEDLLAFYEQVKQFIRSPIFIPKTLPIPELPDHFILGFPTKSNYAKKSLFFDEVLAQQRPIHLLGGSLYRQFVLWRVAGGNVISLDNNYISRQASFRNAEILDYDSLQRRSFTFRAGSFINTNVLRFVLDHFIDEDLRLRALVVAVLIRSFFRTVSFSSPERTKASYWQALDASMQSFSALFSQPFLSLFDVLLTDENIIRAVWAAISQRLANHPFVSSQTSERIVSLFCA
jgi:hypothetical protein